MCPEPSVGALLIKSESEQHVNGAVEKPGTRRAMFWIIARFLLTWLSFCVILWGMALLTDINWTRPYVQSALNNTLHRKVTLGKLSWSFGLNGLAIDTTALKIVAQNGEPFLNAKHSEIGIAFLPLFEKRLIIRHLDFQEPEFWAVRTSGKKWNFSDLLEYTTDIRFIRCDEGSLHVIDRGAAIPSWKQLDLAQVKVSFVFPRKNRKTPFYAAFKLPAKDYTTSVSIDGARISKGKVWEDNPWTFQLKTEQLNPDDFVALARALAPDTVRSNLGDNKVNGLFDVTATGDGTVSKGFNGQIDCSGKQVSLTLPSIGAYKADQASVVSTLQVDQKSLSWQDTTLNFANIALKSSGEISDWTAANPAYKATIGGKIEDLSSIDKLAAVQQDSLGDNALKKWKGKAEVEIRLAGTKSGTTCETQLKAEEVVAQDVIDNLPKEARPVMELIGLSPNAKIRAELRIVPDKLIELKQAELPLSVGKVILGGQIDLKTNESTLHFSGKNLSLAGAQDKLNSNVHGGHEPALALAKSTNFKLNGNFDVEGDYTTSHRGTAGSGALTLHDAQIGLSDGSLTTKKVNGQITWDDDSVKFNNVVGRMGDGNFQINGKSGLGKGSRIGMQLTEQHAPLEQLETVLSILNVKSPILTERQLYGQVGDLHLKIDGAIAGPAIFLSATPEDLFYKPPGLGRPLRARSGNIIYDKDNLSLSDLGLVLHNDKVITTLTIQNLCKKANIDAVTFKTAGVGLDDIDYYLASALMPSPLKTAYADFLKSYKLKAVHGRVYGNGTCHLKGPQFDLDGSIGLINVGAKVAAEEFPVEHVSGILSASSDDLKIDGLSGNIRNSRFTMDGHVEKYKEVNPKWHTKLTARLDPKELLELIPAVSDEAQQFGIRVAASSSVDLKATINGDPNHSDIEFGLRADPADKMVITCPLGKIYQPAQQAMTLDGLMAITTSGFDCDHARLVIGDSRLDLSGRLQYPPKSAHLDRKAELSNSTVDFKISTPSSIQAFKLAALVDPAMTEKKMSGSISGDLHVTGTVNALSPYGNLTIKNLSSSEHDIHDLTGTISMQRHADTAQETGIVQISSMRYKKLAVKNASADITFKTIAGADGPEINLSNGTLDTAGGSATFHAMLDMAHQKYNLIADLNKMKSGDVFDDVLEHPGEVTGLADGHLDIATEGSDMKTWMSNISGSAKFTLYSGSISRFGQLQAKLTQANLLRQGLFGFNLNNLLQSVYPVRTGRFHELTAHVEMHKGHISISHIRYNGDDMRLWGAGNANLPLNSVDLEIAGQIPRVSTSVIGGPVGEMSRAFTLQKMMGVVTMHQLESLPALPVIGDLAANKPRTFTFHMLAPMDQPTLLSKSIEKSFHWLPTKPNATAHPVPGVQ